MDSNATIDPTLEQERQVPEQSQNLCIGIDIGSVSIKLAVLGTGLSQITCPEDFTAHYSRLSPILLSRYTRTKGNSFQATLEILSRLLTVVPHNIKYTIAVTGSGGKFFYNRVGGLYVNEFTAVAKAIGMLHPEARTIIEIGGENAKYLLLNDPTYNGTAALADYEKNGDCAAGTGSFIDQQANRLKYKTEAVGDLVAHAGKAATIAGRCSVFAKSDMIHAQQRGFQPPEILKGLCQAAIRNFKSAIVKGKPVIPKVAFIGGVAANRGAVEAVREIFELAGDDLFVPEAYAWFGAIGAALMAKETIADGGRPPLGNSLMSRTVETTSSFASHDPLNVERVTFLRNHVMPYSFEGKSFPVDIYLGIDIGSVSTNFVLLDDGGSIVHEIYVYTEARPIEVVRNGLKQIEQVFGDAIVIRGVGTTGSGRELIGELVGADIVTDEITAHKTGAMYLSRKLINEVPDTIFEIGGQDSKFIGLQDGIVTDFTMNEACAAGTGSFLEEQAEKLGISIKDQFSALAMSSRNPIKLGERCTVFMERDVNAYLHMGARKEDIIAGLAYSIVLNYLNRVVRGRKIGDIIYFQGGTAYNDAVAAAFSIILNKRIIVPPYNGVVGAIGIALLAQERAKALGDKTRFRGFQIDKSGYRVKRFTCKACSNYCDIQQFMSGTDKSYWGDKCSDKFRKKRRIESQPVIQNLFQLRDHLLCNAYKERNSGEITIGIPRSMQFYEFFPFWFQYFSELGFNVLVSDQTSTRIVHAGIEAAIAEPCFPIKVALGHIHNLLEKQPDVLFQPNLIDAETRFRRTNSHFCPWSQTLPFVIQSSPLVNGGNRNPRLQDGRFLMPTIHFRRGPAIVAEELYYAVKKFGVKRRANDAAVRSAYQAQKIFQDSLRSLGKEALRTLERENAIGIVLIGRIYNLHDPGLNMSIAQKLRDIYGINVIPMDMLDADRFDVTSINDNMYWNSGRRILQVSMLVKTNPHLHLIYLTNFKCGPDSYIKHYVGTASGKPYLTLQFDEHSNDAGISTRCEAYLDSKVFLRRWKQTNRSKAEVLA